MQFPKSPGEDIGKSPTGGPEFWTTKPANFLERCGFRAKERIFSLILINFGEDDFSAK